MEHKKYFTELESLRGIAALMVCIFHIKHWCILKNIHFVSHFDLFVDFFFVLSGFVITLNFSNSVFNGVTYKNYLERRFFRLYPLFLAASIPYFITSILKTYFHSNSFQTTNYFKISDFLFYITLTFKWGFVKDLIFNHPSWSISVELLLYIIIGLLFILKNNRKINIAINILLSLISVAVLVIWGAGLNTTGSMSIFRGIFSFFMGSTLFYFYNNTKNRVPEKVKNNFGYFYFILTMLLLTGAFWAVDTNTRVAFVFPLLWASIIWMIINNKYPLLITRFLKLKYTLYMGTISYSFYLIHPLMIFVTEKVLKKTLLENNGFLSIAGILFYLSLTIIVSALAYRYIESPGKHLYKYFKSPAADNQTYDSRH